MQIQDQEALEAVLQAHTVALTSLFATHPDPRGLWQTFEIVAGERPHPDPMYAVAIELLRGAIPLPR